jgi:hypothetical protein
MHALGADPLDLVVARFQFDADFSTGGLKSLDVIVESKEHTISSRYNVEYYVALGYGGIHDRDLGLLSGHVPPLEEGNAFVRHSVLFQ